NCSKNSFGQLVEPAYQFFMQLQAQQQVLPLGAAADNLGFDPTEKEQVRNLLSQYPCFADLIENDLPSAGILLQLAQRNLGVTISASNVEAVRQEVENI